MPVGTMLRARSDFACTFAVSSFADVHTTRRIALPPAFAHSRRDTLDVIARAAGVSIALERVPRGGVVAAVVSGALSGVERACVDIALAKESTLVPALEGVCVHVLVRVWVCRFTYLSR
jgi:hypothetical protein